MIGQPFRGNVDLKNVNAPNENRDCASVPERVNRLFCMHWSNSK